MLKSAGADVQREDRWHGTAVQDALRYQHYLIAKELGADVATVRKHGAAAAAAEGAKLHAPGSDQKAESPLLNGASGQQAMSELVLGHEINTVEAIGRR